MNKINIKTMDINSVFRKMLFFPAAALLLGIFLPAQSQDLILIKNGTLVTVTSGVMDSGCLLIENGRIAKIGRDLQAPAGAKVIDAQGKFVYPGLVAPFTAIGVTGYPGAGNDTDEVGLVTPQIDPYDALNPEDDCIDVTRIGGVTTALTISGTRHVIDGESILINLDGTLPRDMVLKRNVAMIFNMGAKERDKYPSTLPGVMSLIRDELIKARRYKERKEKNTDNNRNKGKSGWEEPFRIDLEMEALIPVLKGETPILFVTQNEVTIRNALQLIKEFNLKGILHIQADAVKCADQLAAEKIPVIWAGTMTIPRRWEPFDLNYHTAAVLAEKGILFAFDQAGWGPESRNARNLPVPAAMSVAHGLSEREAVKAMTINTAKILGVDSLLGSLEEGKMANVVIWDGNPLQMSARVHTVIIGGKIIPLTSVQTRLRDKFEKIVRERMEKK